MLSKGAEGDEERSYDEQDSLKRTPTKAVNKQDGQSGLNNTAMWWNGFIHDGHTEELSSSLNRLFVCLCQKEHG